MTTHRLPAETADNPTTEDPQAPEVPKGPTAPENTEAVRSLIALLDAADAAPRAADLRELSHRLLHAAPGTVVADVGCGAGRAVAELRERGVGAIGVDPDPTMLAAARSRFPAAEFRAGEAYALPFRDRELAGYRADKVFHELTDPARALAEARRVLAPGGRIVLIGQDWDTVVIDADDAALTRAIVHARADLVPAPRNARRYRNLLLEAGFADVAVEVHTAVFTEEFVLEMLEGMAAAVVRSGAVTSEAAESWTTDQRHRAAVGRLFVAIPMFAASARVPGEQALPSAP